MKSLAIRKAHPEVVSVLCDNDSVWTAWDKDGKEIELDEESIELELEKIKVERKAIEYKKLRKVEYPEIGDQLDALYHAGLFPKEMAAKLKAVKDKHPKPEIIDGN